MSHKPDVVGISVETEIDRGQLTEAMTTDEIIARTLCNWEGRQPDHQATPGEPQWRRYESQARAIIRSLRELGRLA